MKKSIAQHAWDAIGIPFRLVILPQELLPRLGWTTLAEECMAAVRPWIVGRLLDVGAGHNALVREYGNGVGVDIFDWGGGALVVQDSSQLPFADASFDTVTLVACLNHIPNRVDALREARRVSAPGGRLIITMIDPVLGGIGHVLWWYGEDRLRGGMKEGERGGLWNRDVIEWCEAAGFRLVAKRRFVYGLNNLFVFETA